MRTQFFQRNDLSIRHILNGNHTLSGLSGILFILASQPVSNFLGLNARWIIFALGWVMIGYSALLYFNAKRSTVSRNFVLFTVIADSTWVAASILFLLTGWIPFSAEGKWAVGVAAMIVDIFATLQFLAWRKM